MKITRYELLRIPPSWVWIRIHTDEGISGLGEPFLEDHADVVSAEVTRLMPLLIGEDPRRTGWLWDKMYNSGCGYRGGPIKLSAISGIDMALWDIKGKALGAPVYELLGGLCRDKVKVYRSCAGEAPYTVEPGQPYRAVGMPPVLGGPGETADARPLPERYADAARTLVREWGFRCLKVHVSFAETVALGTSVALAADCFAAVRDAVGYDVDVAIDVHNPHPNYALQLARALEPYRPLFLEEPAPPERVDLLRRIAGGTTVPVAAGERWMGKWAFREALDAGAAVLQPDIAHAGGFTELAKIAAIAESHFAVVAPHCPLSPLSFAACVQFAAAAPNFLVQEHNEVNDSRADGRTLIGRGFFREPFALDADGCVAVPRLPGLGVELDDAGMAAIAQLPWREQRG
ncbi:MAG: galactonate dehydratase [Paenibacillaceae bacterium]|nr:galactonate dehydratase [Paenibacillaceae bacterium]